MYTLHFHPVDALVDVHAPVDVHVHVHVRTHCTVSRLIPLFKII